MSKLWDMLTVSSPMSLKARILGAEERRYICNIKEVK